MTSTARIPAEERLIATLADLVDGGILIVGDPAAPPEPRQGLLRRRPKPRPGRYVQYLRTGMFLACECVGATSFGGDLPLTAEQEKAIRGIGWRLPTDASDAEPVPGLPQLSPHRVRGRDAGSSSPRGRCAGCARATPGRTELGAPNVPPEPDLLAHIRARGYHAATVEGDVREAARAALSASADEYECKLRLWQVATGQLADPARFSFEFQERLRGIGWTPGRDVSDVVDPWLGKALPRLREFEFTRRGYREVQPFAAAMRVLYEFGGVHSGDAGPGVTTARIPFLVFPGERREERSLWLGALTVAELAARLGQQVFQLGTVENGTALLVIAADGSVHLAGAVDRFVAASFDDALAALLDGDLPDPADNPYEIDPFA